MWGKSYPAHIVSSLQNIIHKVGIILLKKLAVLFPSVYKCFLLSTEVVPLKSPSLVKLFLRDTCLHASPVFSVNISFVNVSNNLMVHYCIGEVPISVTHYQKPYTFYAI